MPADSSFRGSRVSRKTPTSSTLWTVPLYMRRMMSPGLTWPSKTRQETTVPRKES